MGGTLAINIGGTTTKWARITGAASGPVRPQIQPTPVDRQAFRAFLAALACQGDPAPERVAIGFPGPVTADGRLRSACTWMPGQDLSDFDLDAEVRSLWPKARTSVINDVSAYGQFLLREGYRDFCVINIGSGIGTKVYLQGEELLGPNCRGGEIGHWADESIPAILRCDCGGAQHVGAMSSGRGVARYARLAAAADLPRYAGSALAAARPRPEDLNETDLLAHADDPWVRRVVGEAMAPLGRAAALIHLATGCECFVLVGGFAEAAGALLTAALAEHSARHAWANGMHWPGAYSVLCDEVRASLLGLHWHGLQHDPH